MRDYHFITYKRACGLPFSLSTWRSVAFPQTILNINFRMRYAQRFPYPGKKGGHAFLSPRRARV